MHSPDRRPHVLVADDQQDVLEALRLLFKGEGFQVDCASSPAGVLRALNDQDYDLLLMDLNYARDTTSGKEGLELLASVNALDPALPIVAMTAWGSVELAVEAMRKGARDFLLKPWENERLLSIIRNQLELRRALQKGKRLETENQFLRRQQESELVARSAAMQPVLELVERVAPSDAHVLVTGENGTGKGVIARVLHAASRRANMPLVVVNMGGFSEGVFESELFGHVKGAFTDAKVDREGRLEMADGGTLFLDEIGNLTLNQQMRLLRVLETGEFERVGSSRTRKVDVRIISATNADLRTEVTAGRFRQDLFFRLNTIEIHLPPLRERTEDIPLLAEEFLRKKAQHYRKDISGFDGTSMKLLQQHSWPGNVRELQHVIERAVLMARNRLIVPADLGLRQEQSSVNSLDEMSLEEVEAYLIKRTLARFDGNVLKAAEAMGLSRSAFYRRLEKYKLER
jgi:DNA-binding NtrC family response regulator